MKPVKTNSLYNILGIVRNAKEADIRDAYKKLVVQAHPDKPGGSAAMFNKVQCAYETLKDPQKRKTYDEFLQVERQMKAFAMHRPVPLDHVKKPVKFNLMDGMPYEFETAPDKMHCRFRHGDVVLNQVDVQGVIVGLASDGVYWVKGDTQGACLLFSPNFGDKDIVLLYRDPNNGGARQTKTYRDTDGLSATRKEVLEREQRRKAEIKIKTIQKEEAARRNDIEAAVDLYFQESSMSLSSWIAQHQKEQSLKKLQAQKELSMPTPFPTKVNVFFRRAPEAAALEGDPTETNNTTPRTSEKSQPVLTPAQKLIASLHSSSKKVTSPPKAEGKENNSSSTTHQSMQHKNKNVASAIRPTETEDCSDSASSDYIEHPSPSSTLRPKANSSPTTEASTPASTPNGVKVPPLKLFNFQSPASKTNKDSRATNGTQGNAHPRGTGAVPSHQRYMDPTSSSVNSPNNKTTAPIRCAPTTKHSLFQNSNGKLRGNGPILAAGKNGNQHSKNNKKMDEEQELSPDPVRASQSPTRPRQASPVPLRSAKILGKTPTTASSRPTTPTGSRCGTPRFQTPRCASTPRRASTPLGSRREELEKALREAREARHQR